MRTGAEYFAALADGRTVYLDGGPVVDVATHPAFAGIVASVAELYDFAANPSNGMGWTDPNTGVFGNKAFLIPRSAADLSARRAAISRWARLTHGFVGRGPDHVAGFLAGFASAPEVFDRPGRSYGRHVVDFYHRMVREDLFMTCVIVPPRTDRSQPSQGGERDFIQVGVVRERSDGIVVGGCQMLGTGAAIADYILVSCIRPLRPGDEAYALSFVVPLSAPGLKIYCRRPYAPAATSEFDYPLSARYDESDAMVVFDDVFIPWPEVFVYRDVEGVRGQFFSTAAHVLVNTQAQIRLIEKMKFIVGVARKITMMNRADRLPSVQEKLADLASLAALVEGMVLAAENTCEIDEFGVARPHPRFVYAPMCLQTEIYPRALDILRDLSGGAIVALPSSYRELVEEDTREDMRRYLGTTGVCAIDRVKLMKLAWDIVGSEFAGRHLQYEMFYAGASFVTKGYAYRNYGYGESIARVDDFLATCQLPNNTGPTNTAPDGDLGAHGLVPLDSAAPARAAERNRPVGEPLR
jgi:4-hydroxyphenylacetate 3-monooxygenase